MTATIASPSLIVQPGQGEQADVAGNRLTFKVDSAATGGAFALIEYDVAPGFRGPPVHWHAVLVELFYVTSGTLTLLVDGERHELGAGGCGLVAPGSLHTFENAGEDRAHFLLVTSPGSHERYLRELLALVARSGEWPPSDPREMMALAERYDTFFPRP